MTEVETAQLVGTPILAPEMTEIETSTPTPRKKLDSTPIPTDSLVTIRLSENSRASVAISDSGSMLFDSSQTPFDVELKKSRSASLAVLEGFEMGDGEQSLGLSLAAELGQTSSNRSSSSGSDENLQVDWEQLDKAEQLEDADGSSDQQTALLLARLEQENNALTSDPKSLQLKRTRTQSRPPSVYQLKKLVQEQGARSVRFSLLPAAAPMTELDFWAALVQDYPQTAQRLPTVTSSKIRAGVPAPLRGVVWTSMAGARDQSLEEQYDRLCTETSPYETIINKDIGRSFPGVAMFRDADGEGQRMLACVLKCYSLYDKEIGYCQGLGFLVGPLLMNMGEKQAFCVLCRLMDDYDLRSCFLPNLAGLHLRIYQFQRLLHQHLPELASHLDKLDVEGAYLSQWFLSFFATTCPLPLLFRIYDVIFAEGASETLMRVALAIMRRNQKKLLSFREMDDCMQLLLSRALWDPYGLSATSADELVGDFVSFTSVVTRESLRALETSFRDAQTAGVGGGFFPAVQSAASRFLGRKLFSSHTPSKSQPLNTLAPNLAAPQAPSRPQSMLMRTASKQSLSTLYSNGDSSEGSTSNASTSITDISLLRDSAADSLSIKSMKSPTDSLARAMTSRTDKDLHSQIEDLLLALTEMQREHASLAIQLQREREERNDDRLLVQSLVNQLKEEPKEPTTPAPTHLNAPSHTRRKTISFSEYFTFSAPETEGPKHLTPDIRKLVQEVDKRLKPKSRHNRKSSGYETKAELITNLANSKEQLQMEASRNHELARQMAEKDIQMNNLHEELAKARARIKNEHSERERLQRTVMDLRQSGGASTPRSAPGSRSSSVHDENRRGSNSDLAGENSPTSSTTPTFGAPSSKGGLREFRLGRTISNQAPPKRTSSLAATAIMQSAEQCHTPPPADEILLQELVAAKTAEAVARQELEELRAKFDGMKRMLGVATAGAGIASTTGAAAAPTSNPSSATLTGRFRAGSLTGSMHSTHSVAPSIAPSAAGDNTDESPAHVASSSSFFFGSGSSSGQRTPDAVAGAASTKATNGNATAAPAVGAPGTTWGGPGGFFSGWGRRAPSTSTPPPGVVVVGDGGRFA